MSHHTDYLSQRIQVEEMVRDMLNQKLIEESTSPWNVPLFLVLKNDGSWLPVIRHLNNITISEL